MELIRTAAELETAAEARRAAGDRVGFVPTMGAIHDGHASLIRRARAESGFVLVSIFVNPLQFGEGEDLEAYPRDEARDLRICERLGVDSVWAPPVDEVYPPGVELPSPDRGPAGNRFEGAARPGHFAGVLTVVRRLFDLVGQSTAYFGEKDAQQLFLVRRMVDRLGLPVRVVGCPTVREPDGLALSSRNALLGPEERIDHIERTRRVEEETRATRSVVVLPAPDGPASATQRSSWPRSRGRWAPPRSPRWTTRGSWTTPRSSRCPRSGTGSRNGRSWRPDSRARG